MKSTALFISVLLLTLSFVAPAQNDQKTITVRVIDNMTKSPVVGATAVCNGQTTTTNGAGYFQLTVPVKGNLSLKHEKYRTLDIVVPEPEKFQLGIDVKDEFIEYGGGMNAFYKFFGENISYPATARSQKIQANIWVEMLIDDEGKSQFVKVHDDVKNVFASTLKKTINKMPGKWGDAYKGMTFLLPVRFELASQARLGEFDTPAIPKHRVMTEMVVTGHIVN